MFDQHRPAAILAAVTGIETEFVRIVIMRLLPKTAGVGRLLRERQRHRGQYPDEHGKQEQSGGKALHSGVHPHGGPIQQRIRESIGYKLVLAQSLCGGNSKVTGLFPALR